MRKVVILFIVILLLACIGGAVFLIIVPEDQIKDKLNKVKENVNIEIEVTPTYLLSKQLEQLSAGHFKEAQEHVNLNLASDLDADYQEVYRLLYQKITFDIISEDHENDIAMVRIRYPYILALINKQDQDDVEIVAKMKADIEEDDLKYIEKEVELKMVNDHLVYTPKLFRVLLLLDETD